MRQGTYVPKGKFACLFVLFICKGSKYRQEKIFFSDIVWLQYFDPLFVMLRSMQMKEYQDAFIRYSDL